MIDDLKNYGRDSFQLFDEYEVAIILLIVFGLMVGLDLWQRYA